MRNWYDGLRFASSNWLLRRRIESGVFARFDDVYFVARSCQKVRQSTNVSIFSFNPSISEVVVLVLAGAASNFLTDFIFSEALHLGKQNNWDEYGLFTQTRALIPIGNLPTTPNNAYDKAREAWFSVSG